MNAMKSLLPFFAVLALSGCVLTGEKPVEAELPVDTAPVYVCRNGETVSARYGSAGQPARITVGGVTVQVEPESAPFGAKFKAGDGTLFWVNGEDALLEWTNGMMLFCREKER